MKVLRRLKCASTRYETFADIPVDTAGVFPHMQELTIKDAKGLSIQSQVDLVCQCPNLKSLKWTVCRDMFFPIQQFCDRIPAACPSLRRLQMDGCGIPYPWDLSRILNSLNQLELVAFCGTTIFSKTFRSMERHFQTMRSLDLADCFTVKSWMAQGVLEGCPLLEVLKVPYLLMSDVEVGKPWVALRLKQLRVHFRTTMLWDVKYYSEHHATFKALGRLAELETLDMSCFEPKSPAGLQFQLDLGLASMGMMRKLTFVKMDDTEHIIGSEELSWIKEHWPRLTKMEGIFHYDWNLHEVATRVLREFGVEVPNQVQPEGPRNRWAFDPRQDRDETDYESIDGDEDDYEYFFSDNDDVEDIDIGSVLEPSEVVSVVNDDDEGDTEGGGMAEQ